MRWSDAAIRMILLVMVPMSGCSFDLAALRGNETDGGLDGGMPSEDAGNRRDDAGNPRDDAGTATDSGVDAGYDAGPDSGPTPGDFGASCDDASQCASGLCEVVDNFCTRDCTVDRFCPSGYTCRDLPGTSPPRAVCSECPGCGSDAGMGMICPPTGATITISEIMVRSRFTPSVDGGQWFEVRNDSDCAVDLSGVELRVRDGAAGWSYFLPPMLPLLPARGVFLIAQSDDMTVNHGLTPDFAYVNRGAGEVVGPVFPSNGVLSLYSGGVELARVSWNAGEYDVGTFLSEHG